MNSVLIVGAGLSGTLLGIALKRRGFEVTVYEARDDLRKCEVGVHRSINLVLTSRGRYALRKLGLEDEVMKLVVPAIGRCIHNLDGSVVVQPYGKDDNEANYSVSRSGLNIHLLDVAEREGVKIHFNERLIDSNIPNREYIFQNTLTNAKKTVKTFICFGADGAGSATRRNLLQHLIDIPVTQLDSSMDKHWQWGGQTAIKFETQRLGISYKELMFPLKPDNSKPLDTRYLHIWPRGNHFLMGLANLDGSMTGTLYLPDDSATFETDESLKSDNLTDVQKGIAYMKKYYPDAVKLMPGLEKMWAENPHSFLATARVSHWVFEDKVCLLGDAGHAVVPFFGQGMNCSFEDVTYIEFAMDFFNVSPHGGNWSDVLKLYQKLRIPAGHAIADLAIENAYEMSAKVGQADFLKKKAIENYIEREMPTLFRSRYWMVTNTQIPYHWTQELGTHIDAVLNELMCTAKSVDGAVIPDMTHARALIAKHVTPYIQKHAIDLTDPWKFYGKVEIGFHGKRSKL